MTGTTLIRAADARRMPWKNGGGETMELLAHPPGAGLDAFDWRVSMATVASDGPFSTFPGIDRTLAILDGEGLELTVADGTPVRLTAESAPFGFPADAPCRGRLLGGPATDLNVMTRRSLFSHTMARLRLDGSSVVASRGSTVLAVCLEGEIAVDGVVLGRHDVAVLMGEAALVPGPGTTAAVALVITITGAAVKA